MKKSILQEIKEQPEHIRELFMWVFVVITFSVVGFAWFRSTEQRFVAMLNPNNVEQTEGLAADQNMPSPFATILTSLKGLQANISELFNFQKNNNTIDVEKNNAVTPTESIKPQKLPLSGSKK